MLQGLCSLHASCTGARRLKSSVSHKGARIAGTRVCACGKPRVWAGGIHWGWWHFAGSTNTGNTVLRCCSCAVLVGDVSDGPGGLRAGAAQGALAALRLWLQHSDAHLPHRGHPRCSLSLCLPHKCRHARRPAKRPVSDSIFSRARALQLSDCMPGGLSLLSRCSGTAAASLAPQMLTCMRLLVISRLPGRRGLGGPPKAQPVRHHRRGAPLPLS